MMDSNQQYMAKPMNTNPSSNYNNSRGMACSQSARRHETQPAQTASQRFQGFQGFQRQDQRLTRFPTSHRNGEMTNTGSAFYFADEER